MVFIPYEVKFKNDIINLLAEIWGGSYERNQLRFENKYEKNPYDKNIYAILALVNNKVVGFRGFVPTRWQCNKEEIWILLVAEAIVNKNYRRKGIFKGMTLKAIEFLQGSKFMYFLNLSANLKSARGNLQLGWREFETKTYHRFTNGFSLIMWRLGFSPPRRIVNEDVKVCKDITIKELNNSLFYTNQSGKITLTNKSEYYNYKRLRYNDYLFFKYYEDKRLVAYVTVDDRYKNSIIVDFEYEDPKYMRIILSVLKSYYYVISVWDISIENLGIKETYLSRFLRFLERKKTPFLYRPIKELHSDIEEAKFIDSHNLDLKNLYAE